MTTYRTAQREAEERAELSGVPADVILPYVEQEILERPVRLVYGAVRSGEMQLWDVLIITSDADPEVSQFNLTLNVGHPWVSDHMLSKDVSRDQRVKIEIMMFILAGSDKRTKEERTFIDTESVEWSRRLYHAENILRTIPGFEPDEQREWDDDENPDA